MLGTRNWARLLTVGLIAANAAAGEPGLPFVEDFSGVALCDTARTWAHWNTQEQAVVLQWGVQSYQVSEDKDVTKAVAVGDMDGDGDMDIVAGNWRQTNRLYLNNGTASPFAGVVPLNITLDAYATADVALGDVDGDGDLDLIAGDALETAGQDARIKLYLNNGTSNPFSGAVALPISDDRHWTKDVDLADVDGDGNLDVLAATLAPARNRVYLNNGTAEPFVGVSGEDIGSDAVDTLAIAVGDVDGDGDLDVVAGNYLAPNRLMLNNGTSHPFAGATSVDISSDADNTRAIELGDMDGDGDLDVVAGNNGANRLYLNGGSPTLFSNSQGIVISTDRMWTAGVTICDVDEDHDLDLVTANYRSPTRLVLNNGTANPFAGVTPTNITADCFPTAQVVAADLDGDMRIDLVEANGESEGPLSANVIRWYRGFLETTLWQPVASMTVDSEEANVWAVRLTATAVEPPGTAIDYFLTNDGGTTWFGATSGAVRAFPCGGSDLRWRAVLQASAPSTTPRLTGIAIEIPYDSDGDGMPDSWEMTYWRAGLNPLDPDDALRDADGDSHCNRAEFVADTDPTDATSQLRLHHIYLASGAARISWSGGAQATQYVERCELNELPNGQWRPIFTNRPPTLLEADFLDTRPPSPGGFYRVTVR